MVDNIDAEAALNRKSHHGSMTGLRKLYWCSGGKGAKARPTKAHKNVKTNI